MENEVRVDFDPGVDSNPIVAIFQNPGSKENEAGHPAAGTTGKNLSILLKMLKEHIDNSSGCVQRDHFTYDSTTPKSGVMVANAHCGVYTSKDNVPIGFDCDHVKFVAEKIKDKRLVLCFGLHAESFYKQIIESACSCKPSCDQKVIFCCHLGLQSLNTLIKNDLKGDVIAKGDKDATRRRLSVVATYVELCLRGQRQVRFKDYVKELEKCHS